MTLDNLVHSGALLGFPEFEPHIMSRIITDGKLKHRVYVLLTD